jgi:hypothetical protein
MYYAGETQRREEYNTCYKTDGGSVGAFKRRRTNPYMERKDIAMSKVVNIGVIIRNEQGDTLPVALTPQMVGVIQNLLMQIPMMDSKLVDPSGKKLASKQSIPIIPREIEFDWGKAYSPMEREEELKLMKKLTEKYAAMEESEATDGKITQLHPERKEGAFTDPENPFNLELDASGRANADMSDVEVEQAMTTEN